MSKQINKQINIELYELLYKDLFLQNQNKITFYIRFDVINKGIRSKIYNTIDNKLHNGNSILSRRVK